LRCSLPLCDTYIGTIIEDAYTPLALVASFQLLTFFLVTTNHPSTRHVGHARDVPRGPHHRPRGRSLSPHM